MPDTTWTVHLPDDTTTAVDAITSPWPTVTVGRTVPFTFWFEGSATSPPSGFTDLKPYLDFPGAAAFGQDINNRPWYKEQLPGVADVDGLIWGVEPATALKEQTVPGVWGLVVGGTDERNAPLSNWRLEVTLFVLARYDRYDDHAAVAADLED